MSDPTPYERAALLTIRLHEQLRADDPEGSVADRIRDELDGVWPQLRDKEREQLRQLSVLLYAQEEIPVAVTELANSFEAVRHRATEAVADRLRSRMARQDPGEWRGMSHQEIRERFHREKPTPEQLLAESGQSDFVRLEDVLRDHQSHLWQATAMSDLPPDEKATAEALFAACPLARPLTPIEVAELAAACQKVLTPEGVMLLRRLAYQWDMGNTLINSLRDKLRRVVETANRIKDSHCEEVEHLRQLLRQFVSLRWDYSESATLRELFDAAEAVVQHKACGESL